MICRACLAKDAQIAALLGQISQQNERLVEVLRDATGLNNKALPTVDVEPLPEQVSDFLALKFNPGTGLHRQQTKAARALLAGGMEPGEVNDTLNKGALVDL